MRCSPILLYVSNTFNPFLKKKIKKKNCKEKYQQFYIEKDGGNISKLIRKVNHRFPICDQKDETSSFSVCRDDACEPNRDQLIK